jgi:hypothetical protein
MISILYSGALTPDGVSDLPSEKNESSSQTASTEILCWKTFKEIGFTFASRKYPTSR